MVEFVGGLLVVLLVVAVILAFIAFGGWMVMLLIGVLHTFTPIGTLGFWPSCGLSLLLALVFNRTVKQTVVYRDH